MSVCTLSRFSHIQLFATPWTIAHQAPLSGISQARILEWVAVSFSNKNVYKSFSTMLDRLEKEHQKNKERERDGEVRKHKLNEMGALNMK